MAALFRLVWRFDFDVSSAFLDKRGTAFKLLTQETGEFWSRSGFHTNIRDSFFADRLSPNGVRNIVVEPNSISGVFEWYDGMDPAKLLQTEEFKTVDRLLKGLMKHCEITKLNRGGIRLFAVTGPKEENADRLQKSLAVLNGGAREFFITSLNNVTDIAFILEGEMADALKYRLQFGPTEEKNIRVSVQNASDSTDFSALLKYRFIADFDLYETNFSFVEHSFFRWARTKLDKANDFLNDLAVKFG